MVDQETLISPENPKASKDELSYLKYMAFAFPISINNMVDFVPITISFFFLGLRDALEAQSIVGFGITYIIFSFGYSPSIMDLVGLQISSFCDRKNYSAATTTLGKIGLCVGVYMAISLLLGVFSREILMLIGIEEHFAARCSVFIKWMTLPKIFEILMYFLRAFLISQKISDVFWPINLLSIFSSIVASYVLMHRIQMNEMGFVFTLLIKTCFEISAYFYVFYTRSNREYLFIPSLKSMKENFWEMFVYSIHILIGNYGEWTAIEINSYFAALTKKTISIVVWSCTMNFCNLHYLLSLGETAYLRTYGSIAVGLKDRSYFKETWKKCVIYGLINHSIISVLIIIFSGSIASFYTYDPEAHRILSNMFKMLGVMFILEWALPVNNTCLRMIDMEAFQFKIMAGVFPIVIAIGSLTFGFGFGLDTYGLLMGFMIGDIVVNTIMLTTFLKHLDPFFDDLEGKKIGISKNSKANSEVDIPVHAPKYQV